MKLNFFNTWLSITIFALVTGFLAFGWKYLAISLHYSIIIAVGIAITLALMWFITNNQAMKITVIPSQYYFWYWLVVVTSLMSICWGVIASAFWWSYWGYAVGTIGLVAVSLFAGAASVKASINSDKKN